MAAKAKKKAGKNLNKTTKKKQVAKKTKKVAATKTSKKSAVTPAKKAATKAASKISKPISKPILNKASKTTKPDSKKLAKIKSSGLPKKPFKNNDTIEAATTNAKDISSGSKQASALALSEKVKTSNISGLNGAAKKPKKKRVTKASLKQEKMVLKWSSLHSRGKNMEAEVYNMKKTYEPKTPIVHKVLGWGYILTNTNDRLEVLFEEGVKYLISNYKA